MFLDKDVRKDVTMVEVDRRCYFQEGSMPAEKVLGIK